MESGYYYPHEISTHSKRQAATKLRGGSTYPLTLPKVGDPEHNYRGGYVEWESVALENALEEGPDHVRQTECVMHRHIYLPGSANFDRYIIVGPGLHPDTVEVDETLITIPNSLHVTAHCDNYEMRKRKRTCTIHQYIDHGQSHNIDPWIGESAMAQEKRSKWRANRRRPPRYRSNSPIGRFPISEFEGRNRKRKSRAIQQRACNKFETRPKRGKRGRGRRGRGRQGRGGRGRRRRRRGGPGRGRRGVEGVEGVVDEGVVGVVERVVPDEIVEVVEGSVGDEVGGII